MEIRTINNSYIGTNKDGNINDAMDAIVCALLLEGYHVNTIRNAMMNKAEAMVEEFNLKEE